MKIFGGILPFIGFRVEEIDADLRRFFNFEAEVTHVNTFQMEWLGFAVVICIEPVEPGE